MISVRVPTDFYMHLLPSKNSCLANLFAFFMVFCPLCTFKIYQSSLHVNSNTSNMLFFIQLAENPDEIDLDDDDEDDEDDDEENGGANGSNGNGDGGPIVERSVGKVEKQAIPAEVFGSLKKDDD